MFARRFQLLAALILSLVVPSAACRKAAPPEAPAAAAPTAEAVPAADVAPTPAATPAATVPDETYGDPSLLAEPRLQFVWNPVERRSRKFDLAEEQQASVYSAKLDGTDLRRAVAPEVLHQGGITLLITDKTPVRSPDGRWIAVAGTEEQGRPARFVVDLKEKKVRKMMVAGAAVHFNWAPDSRRVFFYGDLELWQYDVTTEKLSRMPMIPSEGLYLVDGGRRFVAVNEEWVTSYDLNGKELRRSKLPFRAGAFHAVSPDGKLLAAAAERSTFVVSLAQPVAVQHREEDWHTEYAFSPDGAALFFFEGGALARLDLRTKAVSQVLALGGRTPGNLTVIAPVVRR